MRENFKIYKSINPPVIDLSKINVPVAMYMAEFDEIGDLQDNRVLKRKIGNMVKHFEVIKNEDHLSLMFSKNMTYFKDVMDLMKKY